MMKETKFTTDILGKPVSATIVNTGAGVTATIAGGDLEHIGAVSIKHPGKDVVTWEFSGHKEATISEKWANVLSSHFDSPAVVSCGIHYDNITKEQIQEVLNGSDDLLSAVIED